MIYNFPSPHPDELLYSLCARYSDRMQYSLPSKLVRELFGRETGARATFPNCLGNLVMNLPFHDNYTVTNLIDNHTLLPLYEPFLPYKRSKLIRSMMEASEGQPIVTWIGMRNKVLPIERLRFCPSCLEKDDEQFGEAYWHRVHQISGIEVCPFHNIYLQNSFVLMYELRNKYKYISVEKAIREQWLPSFNKVDNHSDKLLKIAQDALWLLQNHNSSIDSYSIQKRYLFLLAEQGLATFSGRVHCTKLLQDFQHYYSNDFLEQLNCQVKSNDHDDWIISIIHRENRAYHPLRHILFIHFLGHSIETFFGLPTEHQPFGVGPWPCLNPVCNNYQQRCIQKCEITYLYARNGLPRGRFSCSCGFTYSRVGPDRSEEDLFRASSVKVYGTLWEAKLRSLWENPGVSATQTKQILGGISWTTLYKRARKLGLLDHQHSEQTSPLIETPMKPRTHFAEMPSPELLDKYRSTWLYMKENNPEYGLKQIEKAIPKECAWLNRHDRDWLRSQFQDIKQAEWKQKDELFAAKVRYSASLKKKEQIVPKRLTMSYIIQDMPQKHIIHKNLEKLPYTKQSIDKNTETVEEFILRRILWIAECFREEKVCPTRAQFLSRGNLYGPQERWISTKIAIDDALRSLGADMT